MPSDLKVDDPDLVSPLAQSLKKVVALVGSALDPIGLLGDKDSQVGSTPVSLRRGRESPRNS